jgi:hypothetical protein
VAERSAATGGRHRWIFEVLARAGAVPQGSERGIHAYQLGDGLSSLLKRDVLRITFRRRLAGHAEVELATPGSWLHDQLIRYALRRGKVTLMHLRPRQDLDRAAILRARRRGTIELSSLEEKRYGVLLIFTFNIAYYSEPPANETLTVTYDAQRGKVVQRPVGRRSLFEAASEPEEGFEPAPAVEVAVAFHHAWEVVQTMSRPREIQKGAQEGLDRELAVRSAITTAYRGGEVRACWQSRCGQESRRRSSCQLSGNRVKEETERPAPGGGRVERWPRFARRWNAGDVRGPDA